MTIRSGHGGAGLTMMTMTVRWLLRREFSSSIAILHVHPDSTRSQTSIGTKMELDVTTRGHMFARIVTRDSGTRTWEGISRVGDV